jgi:diguanylate cyclase (GGDEF)-like protein
LREKVKKAGAVEFVYQLALPGGKTIWLKDQANIEVFAEDQICLSIGCLTEVTKEMEQKDLLEKMGYFDELTQLPKRTILQRIIEMNIGNLRRGHIKDFVFLLLDLDHFKAVNDTHGHQAGDQVLVGFAEVMRATKRHEDEIGRYGGEEFYGFSIGGLKNGLQFAERLRLAVANTDFHLQSGADSGHRLRRPGRSEPARGGGGNQYRGVGAGSGSAVVCGQGRRAKSGRFSRLTDVPTTIATAGG